MSNAFEETKLLWQGKEYTIPSNRMMGAIARIEDVVTLSELRAFSTRGGAPVGKLAMAYGAMLRYAGADVTDDDVYITLFAGGDQVAIITAIKNVMLMMVPPAMRKDVEAGRSVKEEGAAKGN